MYRHLTQTDDWCESIADLYEKGISVSSMSKVFSLAGLRLGWIATRDADVVKACLSHRDYDLISCGKSSRVTMPFSVRKLTAAAKSLRFPILALRLHAPAFRPS